jgi:hypothetical protein
VNALLAIAPVATWGIQEWFVFIIVLAAVIGIVYLALQYFGIEVPTIIWRIILIVIVAAVAIMAVRFLFSL